MFKCPCGFKTTSRISFRSHLRTCSSAKRRMVQHRTVVDDEDVFTLFDIDTSFGSTTDTDFTPGGGYFGGGGASGDFD